MGPEEMLYDDRPEESESQSVRLAELNERLQHQEQVEHFERDVNERFDERFDAHIGEGEEEEDVPPANDVMVDDNGIHLAPGATMAELFAAEGSVEGPDVGKLHLDKEIEDSYGPETREAFDRLRADPERARRTPVEEFFKNVIESAPLLSDDDEDEEDDDEDVPAVAPASPPADEPPSVAVPTTTEVPTPADAGQQTAL